MKIVYNFQQLSIFTKPFITLDIRPGIECLNFGLRLNLGVNELIPEIYEQFKKQPPEVFYEKRCS